MCFGAAKAGPRLLYAAFEGCVGVTPTVRHELSRNATRHPTLPKGKAAAAFSRGGGYDSLLSARFQKSDEKERATAQFHLEAGTLPSDPPADLLQPPEGLEDGDAPIDGDHVGEAESIAVAMRTGVSILMTDEGGNAYAAHRGIKSLSFTRALMRLNTVEQPQDLFLTWKTVSRNHYTGREVPTGPSFFRPPPKQPGQAPPRSSPDGVH
jgi:hypothetical protein